ncbi:MAG: rhodanese-like domain-containing protein [Spirosomataceae bacterium]
MKKSYIIPLFILFVRISYAQEMRAVTPQEASMMANRNTLVIDLRTPVEFAEKTFDVKKGIHIPIEDFEERLATIPKNRSIVLACRTGNKSKKAYEILEKNGFTKMVYLEGGIVAWSDAGLAVKVGLADKPQRKLEIDRKERRKKLGKGNIN